MVREYTASDLMAIRRAFDINSLDQEAQDSIDMMAGEVPGSVTPEDEAESSLPLNGAIEVVVFSQTKEYQAILGILNDHISQWTTKAENLKLPSDERQAFQTMALGVKKAKAAIGEHVLLHVERVKNTTVQERAAMPSNALELVAQMTAAPDPEVESSGNWIESQVPSFEKPSLKTQRESERENAKNVAKFVDGLAADRAKLQPVRLDGIDFLTPEEVD